MPFTYFVPSLEQQAQRDEVFQRMQSEGLLRAVFSAHARPTLDVWRTLSHPKVAWLVRCENTSTGALLGAGLFTPVRGQVWEFDFTAFRDTVSLAVDMARGGFAWLFANSPCQTLFGVCPARNRHAWRLAEACGFRVLERVSGACWLADKEHYADGVLVMLQRQHFQEVPNG